ncbi:MAG: hypothetical protein LUC43_09355 [Burkholderiales bacterium]|nr:hypothetical protein [Burkholderiales bacterium]
MGGQQKVLLLPRRVPRTPSEIRACIRKCKRMVTKQALVSAGASIVPIPGINVTIDVTVMASILNSVNNEFGLSPIELQSLSTTQRLQIFRCITAVGSAWAGKFITVPLIMAALKKLSLQLTVTQITKWVPILGQLAAASVSFAAMKYIGNKHIEDCARIATMYAQNTTRRIQPRPTDIEA